MKGEAVRLRAEPGKCPQSQGMRRKRKYLIRQRLNQSRSKTRERMQYSSFDEFDAALKREMISTK